MKLNLMTNESANSTHAAASIVHDLRSPLSTIHGSAELLIRAGLSDQQVHRIARNVYGASVRMKELLDEFLHQYRGSCVGGESSLRQLLAGAVERIAALAESQSVQIFQSVPETLVTVLDRDRLQRVFVNLLLNALEVMPEEGTILISAVPERSSVLIKVRDTGPGIAPEIRDRLFQPFVTARKTGGVGLGLALARQTVRDHGGEIWLEPSYGGACFAVRLPRAPQRLFKLTRDSRGCAAPVELQETTV